MTDFEQRWRDRRKDWMEKHGDRAYNGKGHIWTGVFLVLIGVAYLLKVSVPDVPEWIFSWQMLLITIGLFIGLRHNFRGPAWFILILIGAAFLLNEWYAHMTVRQYIWPVIFIAAGLFFILRPRRRRFCGNEPANPNTTSNATSTTTADPNTQRIESAQVTSDDYVDATSVFGGTKKNVVSKNFRGGDVVNIFGGSELNLGQADIHGRVELEVTQIFGGTKILVPSNWEVKPEMVAIFGGIEDKRDVSTASNPDKVLVLKGTSIFAGIEIRNL